MIEIDTYLRGHLSYLSAHLWGHQEGQHQKALLTLELSGQLQVHFRSLPAAPSFLSAEKSLETPKRPVVGTARK